MNRIAGGFTFLGGLMVILGAIAPWATSEGAFSENGFARGDGWIAVGVAVGLLALGGLASTRNEIRWLRVGAMGLGIAGAVFGIAENAKVSSSIANGPVAALSPAVHVGIGIYLMIAGSLLAAVAAWRGRLGELTGNR